MSLQAISFIEYRKEALVLVPLFGKILDRFYCVVMIFQQKAPVHPGNGKHRRSRKHQFVATEFLPRVTKEFSGILIGFLSRFRPTIHDIIGGVGVIRADINVQPFKAVFHAKNIFTFLHFLKIFLITFMA